MWNPDDEGEEEEVSIAVAGTPSEEPFPQRHEEAANDDGHKAKEKMQDEQIIRAGGFLGTAGIGSSEGSFIVPIHMVEAAYRKPAPAKPKSQPFRTGLLARMQAAGGIRQPLGRRPHSWIESLLVPIFGQLRQE